MSWYLKARSIHPNSEMAQEAIDRLSREFLGGGERAETPSGAALADGYSD